MQASHKGVHLRHALHVRLHRPEVRFLRRECVGGPPKPFGAAAAVAAPVAGCGGRGHLDGGTDGCGVVEGGATDLHQGAGQEGLV